MNTNQQAKEEIGNPDDWSYEVRAIKPVKQEEPMFPAGFIADLHLQGSGGRNVGKRY